MRVSIANFEVQFIFIYVSPRSNKRPDLDLPWCLHAAKLAVAHVDYDCGGLTRSHAKSTSQLLLNFPRLNTTFKNSPVANYD